MKKLLLPLLLFFHLATAHAGGPIIMNPGGQALSPTDSPTFTGITLGSTLVTSDNANEIILRNGTTPQQLTIPNTWTSNSVNERLEFLWVSNVGVIRTAHTGATVRNLALRYSNTAFDAINIGVNTAAGLGVDISYPTTLTTASTKPLLRVGNLFIATATSGTQILSGIVGSFAPTATSTMLGVPLNIASTINYSNGTPGAGAYRAINIAMTETALPTGSSYFIFAANGSAGTTEAFSVERDGDLRVRGTVGVSLTCSVIPTAITIVGGIITSATGGTCS